jgi:outer membrane protein
VVARRAVVSARESLRILDSQYREGIASMVDLLDTQAAATQAEGNLVQAMHDYHVSLARVEFTGAPVDIAGEESE